MPVEQAAFMDALIDDPEDVTTRMIYADWLEENGLDQEAANQRKWTPEYQQAYNWMMAFSVISEVPYKDLLTSADDDNWSSYTFNSNTKSYDATDLFNTHRDRFWKYYSILNEIDEKEVQDKDLYFSCSC